MSHDHFTEVTSQSWFSRIGGAFKGILVGLVLFVLAFPILFLNEGRAVTTYKALKEGGSSVISVAADHVDPSNEGCLIHVTGLADTEATLSDPVFEVSANALKLKRTVELYQWKQTSSSTTRKKLGGGTETVTEYSYSKTWSDGLIHSEHFKQPDGHQNPAAMPFTPIEQIADHVSLDAFTLSPALIDKITPFEPLRIGPDTPLPEALKEAAHVYNAGFYIGTNMTHPQVGDARVNFEAVHPTDVSIIGKQSGTTFAPYDTKTGKSILLLQTGTHTADAMIEAAQASNKMMTWLLRLAGFLCMLLALNMIFKPLSVIADVLPIAGRIVGAGTGIVAVLVAAPLSLITISIAWIVYRPLLGIILLIVASGLAVALKGKLTSAKTT